MSSSNQTINDPLNVKRPSAETRFSLVKSDEQEEVDYMALLAMVFGLMGVLMKYRVFVWQSLVCSIVSVINMKPGNLDFRQIFSSFSIAIMGLFMAYVGPQSYHFI